MIAGALAASPTDLQAQDDGYNPRMVLKTNPLSALGGPFWVLIVPVTGEYKVLYEIKTMPKQSLMVGGSYLGPSLLLNLDEITSSGNDISGIKTAGFKVQGMYKFFITRNTEAPEGFYVGPHASYASATIASQDNPDDFVTATKINVNGVLGYQLIADSGFALDIYAGLGYRNRQWAFEGDSNTLFELTDNVASPTVAFGLNFGYAF